MERESIGVSPAPDHKEFMTHIEIEECLGELRKEIKGETNDLDEVRIAICKAQNILQKWIEHNCNRSEWKHIKQNLTQRIYAND